MMVTTFPSMVATAAFELVYVSAPVLFVVGATIVNGASPYAFAMGLKFENMGAPGLTVMLVVIVADVKLAVVACVAVMVALPAPTIVTTLSTIVATAVLELEYVITPLLLVVGGVMAKGTSPNVFVIAAKLLTTVVALLTVRVAVAVPVV
jgi:hypothetical protein